MTTSKRPLAVGDRVRVGRVGRVYGTVSIYNIGASIAEVNLDCGTRAWFGVNVLRRLKPREAPQCKHTNTVICEPHLAGARRCIDCGMVYNPNSAPRWQLERVAREWWINIPQRGRLCHVYTNEIEAIEGRRLANGAPSQDRITVHVREVLDPEGGKS